MQCGFNWSARLVVASSALRIRCRSLKTGPPSRAQMLFGSGERLLGTEAALGLAALGLLPPLAPWALAFLHLWRRR